MPKTAVVLLANGTEEIEAITPGDVLNRCGVDVTYAGVGGTELMGGHHVPLRAECVVEDLEILFDAIIIPRGRAWRTSHSDGATSLIRGSGEGKIIAAIARRRWCAAGDPQREAHATCYPGMERRFTHEIKGCESEVVMDGRIITSRGPGTAMAFSLAHRGATARTLRAGSAPQGMLVHGA